MYMQRQSITMSDDNQHQETDAAGGQYNNNATIDGDQQQPSHARHPPLCCIHNGNAIDVHRPQIDSFNDPLLAYDAPLFVNNGCYTHPRPQEGGSRSGGSVMIRAPSWMTTVASSHYATRGPCTNFTRRPVGNNAVVAAAPSSSNFNGQFMTRLGSPSALSSDYAGRFTHIFTPATANATSSVTHPNNHMISPTNPFYGTATSLLQGPPNHATADGLPPINYPALWPFNPTHSTSHPPAPFRTKGNNAAVDGSGGGQALVPKRPKLSCQPIQSQKTTPTGRQDNGTTTTIDHGVQVSNNPSIQEMKKRVGPGRPPKGSSSSPNLQQEKHKADKPIHMIAHSIRIGQWMTVNAGCDLLAKCYFKRHKLAWECLFPDTKRKKSMEILWKFITSIQISSTPQGVEILRVEVSQPPRFCQEIKVPVRTHSIWGKCEDFTGGQALSCMIHELEFEPGRLSDDFKMALKEHKVLGKLITSPLLLTHASSSSHKPAQSQGSSHPPWISDVVRADHVEVLSAYDPLIQNNLAANNNDIIGTDRRNIQTVTEPSDWHSFHQDVGDALPGYDSDSDLLGTINDVLDFPNPTQDEEEEDWLQYITISDIPSTTPEHKEDRKIDTY